MSINQMVEWKVSSHPHEQPDVIIKANINIGKEGVLKILRNLMSDIEEKPEFDVQAMKQEAEVRRQAQHDIDSMLCNSDWAEEQPPEERRNYAMELQSIADKHGIELHEPTRQWIKAMMD